MIRWREFWAGDPPVFKGNQWYWFTPCGVTITIPSWCSPEDMCRDLDADCLSVYDKPKCYTHDPEQGLCPWIIGLVE